MSSSLPKFFTAVTKYDQKKPKPTSFCHGTCGQFQVDYTDSAMKIKDIMWDKIILGTWKYSKANRRPVSSSIIVDDDMDTNQGFNVCVQLVEVDSDLE